MGKDAPIKLPIQTMHYRVIEFLMDLRMRDLSRSKGSEKAAAVKPATMEAISWVFLEAGEPAASFVILAEMNSFA